MTKEQTKRDLYDNPEKTAFAMRPESEKIYNQVCKIDKQTNGWEEDFVEKGADLEHTRWSKWQRYLHSKMKSDGDGGMVLDYTDYKHWERQINTPYSELSETEKESDRREVREYLPLIKEIISQEREKWEAEKREENEDMRRDRNY